jgi:hypothetical protein
MLCQSQIQGYHVAHGKASKQSNEKTSKGVSREHQYLRMTLSALRISILELMILTDALCSSGIIGLGDLDS